MDFISRDALASIPIRVPPYLFGQRKGIKTVSARVVKTMRENFDRTTSTLNGIGIYYECYSTSRYTVPVHYILDVLWYLASYSLK